MIREKQITKAHAASIKAVRTGKKIKRILISLSETSVVTIVLSVFTVFLVHLYLALSSKDFTWVSSFGALLSIFAILIISSESLFSNLDTDILNIYPNKNPKHIDTFGADGSSYAIGESSNESELEGRRKEFNIKYKNIGLYLWMTIIGTLIWAYSGFLNEVFYPK